LGFIIGFALSIVLSFWLEFIDNTFKTKEQLEEIIGIPVIGLIPIERI
jgi:capsular polysaccharide biosynthesis protein